MSENLPVYNLRSLKDELDALEERVRVLESDPEVQGSPFDSAAPSAAGAEVMPSAYEDYLGSDWGGPE